MNGHESKGIFRYQSNSLEGTITKKKGLKVLLAVLLVVAMTATLIPPSSATAQEWTVQQFELNFDANIDGDVTGMPEALVDDAGTELVIPPETPVCEGYEFLGWNSSPDGTGQNFQPGDPLPLGQHETLYAQWGEVVVCDTFYVVRYLDAMTGRELAPSNYIEGVLYGETVSEDALAIPGYTPQLATQQMVFEYDGQEMTFYYVLASQVSYTVRHLETSTYEEVAPAQTLWGAPNTILVPLALDIEGYAKDFGNWGWVQQDAVFTVYYTRNAQLPYTIYYIDWQTGQEIAPATQAQGTYQDFSNVAFGAKPIVPGYTSRGSYSWSGKQWTAENTHYIKLYYEIWIE